MHGLFALNKIADIFENSDCEADRMDTREIANLFKGRRCVSNLFLPTLEKKASNKILIDLHPEKLKNNFYF